MFVTQELYDELVMLENAVLDENGKERLNPRPKTIPSDLQKPLNLEQRIRKLMRAELSRQAEAQGHESWEEANDFDVSEENDAPDSRYTLMDDEILTPVSPPPQNGGETAAEDLEVKPDEIPEKEDTTDET